MNDRQYRRQALEDALASRILVLDGAMGTMLQQRHLTAADFGGAALEGCNEYLVLTRPDVIRDIHRAYFEAGADIVETDSFQSSKIVLAEYGLADRSYAISFAAAQLARQVAEEVSSAGRVRFVAGSMGPTTKAISVSGGVTFAELEASYYEQAKGLFEGGADALLLYT
jgi:5-methyltetrahydrofolate--homocysteine methyltransferase